MCLLDVSGVRQFCEDTPSYPSYEELFGHVPASKGFHRLALRLDEPFPAAVFVLNEDLDVDGP